MQVNATLIAAQQAAREAQARFQAIHAPQAANKPAQASFASALGEDFAPLPLKQTAASAPAQAPVQSQAPARMGSLLDITV